MGGYEAQFYDVTGIGSRGFVFFMIDRFSSETAKAANDL